MYKSRFATCHHCLCLLSCLPADLEVAEDNYEKAKKELDATIAELGDL